MMVTSVHKTFVIGIPELPIPLLTAMITMFAQLTLATRTLDAETWSTLALTVTHALLILVIALNLWVLNASIHASMVALNARMLVITSSRAHHLTDATLLFVTLLARSAPILHSIVMITTSVPTTTVKVETV